MAAIRDAVSRRDAMKTALKAGVYAAPVILATVVPAAVSAATPPPSPGPTGLVLTNTVNTPAPARGATLNFSIGILNLGPTVATGIVVTFIKPPGIPFSGDGFDIGNYDGTTWTIPSLGVGAGGTLTLVAVANASGTLVANLTATTPNPNLGVSTASASVTLVS